MTAGQLKKLREALGMTQEQLAKRLGLTRVSVARYEAGMQPIPKLVELAVRSVERDAKESGRS